MEVLDIVSSRGDEVLKTAFSLSELDRALGFAGPESMSPLVSLSQRVNEVLGQNEGFRFELHDFSPSSPTIMDPDLWVRTHGGYWQSDKQIDYYINLISS
jgi:hypothetical protein